MPICKDIFLDRNGEESLVYTEALKEHGPELAEQIYIEHMFNSSDIKFSTDTTLVHPKIEKLDDLNESLERDDETGEYIDHDTRVAYTATTKIIPNLPQRAVAGKPDYASLFGGGTDTETEEEKLDRWARRALKDIVIKRDKDFAGIEYREEIDNLYIQKIKDDAYVEEWMAFIKNMWASRTEQGTRAHEAIANALLLVNEHRKEQLENPNIVRQTAREFIYSEGLNELQQEIDEAGIDREVIALIADNIEAKEKAWGLDYGTLEVRVEQKLSNNDMGVAGTTDIMIVNPYNNDAWLYDIKTTSDAKFDSVEDMTSEKLGGPFRGLSNNKQNRGTAQLSYYGTMAQQMGFKIRGAEIIFITGSPNIVRSTRENAPSEMEHSLVGLKIKTEGPGQVTGIKQADLKIAEVYQYSTGEDWDDKLQTKRASGFYGVLNKWSKDQIEYMGNEVRNKREYINSRYNKLAMKDDVGNYIYQDNDPTSETYGEEQKLTSAQYSTNGGRDAKKIFEEEWKGIQQEKRLLGAQLLDWFKSQGEGYNRFGNRNAAIADLFGSIDPSTHNLYIAQDKWPDLFGDLGADVLIAIDKRNGNISLFSAMGAKNDILKFPQDGSISRFDDKTNIFGAYATDGEVGRDPTIPAEMRGVAATEHDMISMKLAVAAMRYKKHIKSNAIVESLVVGSILGGNMKEINVFDIGVEMNKLKTFRKYMGDDWRSNSTLIEIGKLLDDKDLSNPAAYSTGALGQLWNYITKTDSLGKGVLLRQSAQWTGYREAAREAAAEYEHGKSRLVSLIKPLFKMKEAFYQSSQLPKDQIALDPEMKLIDAALREVLDIEANTTQLLGDNLSNMNLISTAADANSYYLQRGVRFTDQFYSQLKMEYREYKRKEKKLKKDFFDEMRQAPGSPSGTDAFKWLYKHYDGTDESLWKPEKQHEWMTLRDESDPFFRRHPKALIYVKFFKAQNKKALIYASTSEKQRAALESDLYKIGGRIPILDRRGDNIRSPMDLTKAMTPSLRGRKYEKKISEGLQRYKIENKFSSEITDAGPQGSRHRRVLLGIEGNETTTKDKDTIEFRLDEVLDATMGAGVNSEYGGMLSAALDVMDNTLLQLKDLHPQLHALVTEREYLTNWVHMTIHNRFKNEGGMASKLDAVNSFASQAVFTFAFRQTVTEGSTATVQAISAGFTGELVKAMGGDPWFTMKSITWASRVWFQNKDNFGKYRTMVEEMGTLHKDPKELLDIAYSKNDKWRLFKSTAGWKLNTMAINNARMQISMAYAYERNFHESYVRITDEYGEKSEYREEKDGRWYVYFDPAEGPTPAWAKNNKLVHTAPPKTAEDIEKYDRWLFQKKIMLREVEGFDPETGRIKIALDNNERVMLNEKITMLLGSMSMDGWLLGDMYSAIRSMGRFKRWFSKKIKTYWRPRNKSQMLIRKKYRPPYTDADGNYVKGEVYEEVDYDEGIINTMWDMIHSVFTLGVKGAYGKGLTTQQKENVARLTVDLSMFFIIAELSKLFFGWLRELAGKDNHLVRTLERSTTNAWEELNFARTLFGASVRDPGMTGSMFPAIMVYVNAARNLGVSTISGMQGDTDSVLNQIGGLTNTIGFASTLKDGYAIATWGQE